MGKVFRVGKSRWVGMIGGGREGRREVMGKGGRNGGEGGSWEVALVWEGEGEGGRVDVYKTDALH